VTKIIFLGDLCVSGSVVPAVSPAANSILQSANFVCINFEAPVIQPGTAPAPKAGPSIHQTEIALDVVTLCCTTHLNLANNHIMDYGGSGLRTTLRMLDKHNIIGAGMSRKSAYQAAWVEHNGERIALLAFGEAQFGALQDLSDDAGFAWIDSPDARRAVLEARTKADWVIVQVHAGLEMVDIPLPEWRTRFRELIDLGADIVIGHHPHVLQGSECYKDKMIHYSLGNFYMDVMLQQAVPGSGGLLEVIIEDGILSSRLIPLRVTQQLIDLDESKKTHQAYQAICYKLTDDAAYMKEIEDICEKFWVDVYSKYYEFASTGFGAKPNISAGLKLLRRLLAYLIRQRWNTQSNELMLIHNIRIETHRWVVERALSKRVSQ